jgi:hypothetical protein
MHVYVIVDYVRKIDEWIMIEGISNSLCELGLAHMFVMLGESGAQDAYFPHTLAG